MKNLLAGAAMLTLLSSAAFAQSPATQNHSNTGQNSAASDQHLAAAQKIKQDLQGAGFTNVKIVAESFVVQAKSKDGDPVVMTIGPHGMSIFEAMNTSGASGSTSGSATTGSSSGGSTNSMSKQ